MSRRLMNRPAEWVKVHQSNPNLPTASVKSAGVSVPQACQPLGQGGRGGLVFDWFAVLVGDAKTFRPVCLVQNPNPTPVQDVGLETLLAIRLPGNGSNQLVMLAGVFRLPASSSPIRHKAFADSGHRQVLRLPRLSIQAFWNQSPL